MRSVHNKVLFSFIEILQHTIKYCKNVTGYLNVLGRLGGIKHLDPLTKILTSALSGIYRVSEINHIDPLAKILPAALSVINRAAENNILKTVSLWNVTCYRQQQLPSFYPESFHVMVMQNEITCGRWQSNSQY